MKLIRIISLLIIILIFGCERNTPVDIIDDGIPPSAPAGVRFFKAFDGEIGIEWPRLKEAGISGYNVYRSINDSLNFIHLRNTPYNYYYDDSLSYDSTYYYYVTAVDQFDLESSRSNIVGIKPINYYAPLPPVYLRSYGKNREDNLYVNLRWQSPEASDIEYFEIFRDTVSFTDQDSIHLIGRTSFPGYVDSNNIELLKNYYYVVRTVDKGSLKSINNPQSIAMVFDRPVITYPVNNYIGYSFDKISFIGVGTSAKYKIIIQENELFDVVKEMKYIGSVPYEKITIPLNTYGLERNKTYFLRIISYSSYSSEANSFSELYNFTIMGH